jgi:methionine-rich copper-binding protein CopC
VFLATIEEIPMRLSQLTLIALVAGAAQTAFAHAELSGSTPASCAMLESAPENVTLNFSEPVRLTALSMQKDGAAKQSLGPLPSEALEQFVVAAPALQDGHYKVSWRALSEDTHVMTGEFMFMVGAAGDHAQHMNCTADADSHEPGHAAEGDHGEHASGH